MRPMRSGMQLLKNVSEPAGAYAIQPLILVSSAAANMLSAASRRKTVLRVAASSSVRGGTSRVLVLPAIDALAITAIAQTDRNFQSGSLPVGTLNSPVSRVTVTS